MANVPDLVVTVKNSGVRSTVISSPGGAAMRLVQLDDVTPLPRANGDVLTWISANAKFEFHAANGSAGSGVFGIDQFARDNSNGAFSKANTANVTAQAAFDKANTANVTAQAAFNQANTANVTGQSAFNQANTANVTAQTAFNLANSISVVPVGSILEFAQTAIPTTIFLPTDGHSVSRTTYADLYAEINVKYGNGDGVTTFGLPDIGPIIPSWFPATDLPAPLEEHTQNTLSDGRLLVIAGINSGSGSVSSSVWFGTIAGNTITWAAGTAIPAVRYHHTTVVLPDGRVLVLGGRDGGGGLTDTAYFGTISGTAITWVAGTVYPSTTAQHTTSLLVDGRILVLGGVSTYQLAYFGTISGTTITWAAGTTIPFETHQHTATIRNGGDRVVMIGGRDSGGAIYNRVYIGNIVGNVITWNQGSYLPVAKSEHMAVPLLDKHLLVAGGVGAPYERTFVGTILSNTSSVIVWEPVRNFPVLPELNSKLAGSVSNEGQVIVTGGYNGGAGSSNSVFIGNQVVTGIRFA